MVHVETGLELAQWKASDVPAERLRRSEIFLLIALIRRQLIAYRHCPQSLLLRKFDLGEGSSEVVANDVKAAEARYCMQ